MTHLLDTLPRRRWFVENKIKCFWERESYVHNRRKRLNHFYHHHHHNNDHQRYRHHDQVVVWVRWSEGVTWQDRLHLFSHQQFSIFIAMLLKMIIVCSGSGVWGGQSAWYNKKIYHINAMINDDSDMTNRKWPWTEFAVLQMFVHNNKDKIMKSASSNRFPL